MVAFDLRENRVRTLIAVGVISTAGAFSPAAPSVLHALLGGAIILVGALPLLFESFAGSRRSHKIFVCSGLAASVFYGLPVFLVSIWAERGRVIKFYDLPFANSELLFPLPVMILALTGLLVFVLSCLVCKSWLKRSSIQIRLPQPTSGIGIAALIWVLFTINFVYHFVPHLQQVPSFGQLALLLGPFSFACFLTFALRRQIGRWQVLAFALMQLLIFVKLFAVTLLAPLLTYGIVAFLVVWRVKERFPRYLVLITIIAVFISYNAAYSARAFTWQGGEYSARAFTWQGGEQAQVSSLSKALIIGSFIIYDLTGLTVGFLDFQKDLVDQQKQNRDHKYALQRMVQRIGHLAHLSVAINVTPKIIPYWQGSSYRPLLTSFIPRVLWPGKPTEKVGGVFARHYWQIYKDPALDPRAGSMSMNLPWMPELYVNFGVAGVIIGMSLFGVFLAMIDKLLNSGEASDLEAVTGLIILLPFVFPDSNFSVMMGSALPLMLFLWGYFKLGKWLCDRPWIQRRENS